MNILLLSVSAWKLQRGLVTLIIWKFLFLIYSQYVSQSQCEIPSASHTSAVFNRCRISFLSFLLTDSDKPEITTISETTSVCFVYENPESFPMHCFCMGGLIVILTIQTCCPWSVLMYFNGEVEKSDYFICFSIIIINILMTNN